MTSDVQAMPYQVPKNVTKASKALCTAILTAAGGPSAIANSLKWDRQYFYRYINCGYVPLISVYEVSSLLGCSPWALSYYKFVEALGEEAPSLETVVKKTPHLVSTEKERILKILHGK